MIASAFHISLLSLFRRSRLFGSAASVISSALNARGSKVPAVHGKDDAAAALKMGALMGTPTSGTPYGAYAVVRCRDVRGCRSGRERK